MNWMISTVVFAALSLSACAYKRASAEQCRAIFDRLVVLELKEMGFQDPALSERRQIELAARYREELATCVGRRIPPGAMTCVASAETAEVVNRDCLR